MITISDDLGLAYSLSSKGKKLFLSLTGGHLFPIYSYLAFRWWTASSIHTSSTMGFPHTALLPVVVSFTRTKDWEGMPICISFIIAICIFAYAFFVAHLILFAILLTLIHFSSCFLLSIHLIPPLCWIRWKCMCESESCFQSHIDQWGLKLGRDCWYFVLQKKKIVFSLSTIKFIPFFQLIFFP